MAKQNRSVIVRYSLIIAVVLCVITFALGFVKRGLESSYYMKDKPEVLKITKIEEIAAKMDSISNDKFVLLNDIYIKDSSFCFGTGDDPFVGEFDGNGYTVYLDYGNDVSDKYSLFGCIGKSGVIKNTCFSFTDNKDSSIDEDTDSSSGGVTAASKIYAGIANINKGTIENCKIDFKRLHMRGNDGVFSPCVAVNYGTISNVSVSCKFDCDVVSETANTIVFGTICAYNYGVLKNSIAAPEYSGLDCVDEAQIVMSDEMENSGIAAVCAFTAASAQTSNTAALLSSCVYTCDKNDSEITVYSSKGELFANAVIFNDLEFDNRVWALVGEELNLINEG